MKFGFVFPGQGSQKVGMGQDLAMHNTRVKAMFDQADQTLDHSLSSLCFSGPEEKLTETENAQPGIFMVSAAALAMLRESGISPSVVAGHSLGELTAYYAAGVFELEKALQIIQARGNAMSQCCVPGQAGMMAVLGLDAAEIEAIVQEFKQAPVVVANYNSPGQIVISGEMQALHHAGEALKAAGAKRVMPLNVAGGFHSPLMAEAARTFETFLTDIPFKNSDVPIILNRSAETETSADALKANLPLQIQSSVQWIHTIQSMAAMVDVIIEIGPGKVLQGLIKKIVPDTPCCSIGDTESLNACLECYCTRSN